MISKPVHTLLLSLAAGLVLGVESCWFELADPYRGWGGIEAQATGRFRVQEIDGVWWFVTPDGHAFFSAGVNHISSRADFAPALGTNPYGDNVLARWGTVEAWAEEMRSRLSTAGVNTAGAWSEIEHFRGRFPYTQILGLGGAAPEIEGTGGGLTGVLLRDYFDPTFETGAVQRAQEAQACAEDAFCIGVYSDNELPWGPGVIQAIPYVDAYLKLAGGAPGKLAVQSFLEERYAGDIAALNATWDVSLASFDDLQALSALGEGPGSDPAAVFEDRLEFRRRVAARYFRVAHDALRAAAPDVLILGARFIAYSTSAVVVEAAASWVDVISVNNYEWNDAWFSVAQNIALANGHLVAAELFGDIDEIHRISGKPVLVTEFGYRAADAGLPNSHPPVYPILPDQRARADAYEAYMRKVLERPYIIGAHFFEYADQPASGRFDGEDNNWGVVTIADDLYPDLVMRMWNVHGDLYPRRAALAAPD